MPLYTYVCPSGHAAELLRAVAVTAVDCPQCSAQAVRQSVYAVNAHGLPTRSPRTPLGERDYSRKFKSFMEASHELAYSHERAEQSAGKELPQAPLWQEARRKANELMQAGVRDSEDLK